MSLNWTCPHCNQIQTVTTGRMSQSTNFMGLSDQAEGGLYLERQIIGCANDECLKSTIYVRIGNRDGQYQAAQIDASQVYFSQRLVPQGSGKPQPDYIPNPLRVDYYEACLIRDLSPKASATLTRRCLQGMIRDFAQIKKGTLNQEITALKQAVESGVADRSISEESVEAIDHVRSVGNIGAHMEKDIDLIVEVDPGEAQALIELVEMLFDEWYGARERRKKRFERVSKIAGAKKEELALQKEAKALPAPTDETDPDDANGGVNSLLGLVQQTSKNIEKE